MGLAIPSFLVYAGAFLAARWLRASLARMPQKGHHGKIQVDPSKLSWYLVQFTRALLCSGNYVLLDLEVPSASLRVRIRVI